MAKYVEDTFGRTVSTPAPGTWGAGELGGTWSVYVNSSNVELYVDGSRGRVSYVAGSSGAANTMLANAQTSLEAHGAIEFRPTGDALGFTIYLWFRVAGAISTFTGYGVRLTRTATAGAITADIVRGPVDSPTVLAALPAGSWPTFTDYTQLELEVTGASPTTIKARYYPAASVPAVDTGWTTVTDSTGPQAAGVYALRCARTSGNTDLHDIVISEAFVAAPLAPAFTTVWGPDGLTATFTSSVLTGGDPRTHAWTFGDGTDAVVQDTSHTYASAGPYSVTYTAWTAWGTRRSVTQVVTAPGSVTPPVPEDIRPAIFVNGEDICDRVYAASWQNGRERWPDESNGSSITLNIRGRMPDVVMGAPVIVQLPAGAPDGTVRLWTGEVDDITESIDPVEAATTTTIVAMDVMAFLSRWHILPATTFTEAALPARTAQLAPRGTTTYRQKWAGVSAARWPLLKSLAMVADGLRARTYLDILRDGLRASLATAYVAPDGVIVYAPLDPPAMPSYRSRVLGGTFAGIPQSHWGLGEASGTFVDSVAGFGGTATGTVTRNVAALADGGDGALSSSTGGGLTYGDLYNKSGTNTWSVGAWVTWDGTAGAYYVMDKLAGAGPYSGWRAYLVNGAPAMLTCNGTSCAGITSTTVLVPGQKYHIVWTWHATSYTIYVNGQLDATATRSINPVGSPAFVTRTLVRGTIDELSIWGAPMGPTNVKGIYYAVPVLDLDTTGPDCADSEDIARSTAEGMVNRWTVGDGSVLDRVERPSIEAYGESVWSVGKGVLKVDSTLPVTDPIAAQLREPFAARTVTVPIRSWAARSYLAQPLDMAQMDGQLFAILGMRHRVSLKDWKVELLLDRDPWTMTGATAPTPPAAAKTRTDTFSCDIDALLASPNMGAGKATRLPVGLYGGTKFRALIRFDLDWTYTPKKILLAELLIDTAGQDAVAYGSTPQIHIDRVIDSWSEGGSGGDGPPWTYSTSNAVVYAGPACTTSGRKSFTVTNAENTSLVLPMTEICRAWADGSSNRGIRIISQDEGSTSRTIEFYSSEYSGSSRRPKLRVKYEY